MWNLFKVNHDNTRTTSLTYPEPDRVNNFLFHVLNHAQYHNYMAKNTSKCWWYILSLKLGKSNKGKYKKYEVQTQKITVITIYNSFKNLLLLNRDSTSILYTTSILLRPQSEIKSCRTCRDGRIKNPAEHLRWSVLRR